MDREIGDRIRSTIKGRTPAVTQQEVAGRVDMTPDAFSRALSGKRSFTAVELVRIAEELGTSVHWFVTGEPDPFAVTMAGRHTYDHVAQKHEDIDWDSVTDVLRSVALAYLQLGDEVSSAREIPAITAAKARELLVDRGGSDFVRGLSGLVKTIFDIDFVRVRGVSGGFALQIGARRVIVVGETGNWFFENWSIAHELAHILLGHLSTLGDRACDDPRAEREANAFAADLLLPASMIRAIDWQAIGETDLADRIWAWGISTDALSRRLGKLQIVPSETIAKILEAKTQAVLRKYSSLVDVNEEISRRMTDAAARSFPEYLVAEHRQAVTEGRISAETLAWMLDVETAELEEQLSPPHFTPVDVDWLAGELGLSDPDS